MKIFNILFFSSIVSFAQVNKKQADSIETIVNSNRLEYQVKVSHLTQLTRYYHQIDIKKAYTLNKAIYTLSKKHNYNQGFGFYYQNLSDRMIFEAKYKNAEICATKAKGYFKKSGDTENEILAVYTIGSALAFQNKNEEAKELVNKFLKKNTTIATSKQVANLYYFLAGLYNDDEMLYTAFNYLNKAAAIFRKNKMRNGEYKCNYEMARICYSNSMYQKTLLYLDKCVAALNPENKNIIEFQVNAYYFYAIVYLDVKNYNKALEYIKKYEAIVLENNLQLNKKDLYLLYSEVFIKTNKTKLAYENLKKLEKETLNENERFEFNLNYSNWLVATENYKKALEYNQLNYELDSKESRNLQSLAIINSKLNNWKEAYRYQNEYANVEIENLKERAKNQVIDYEFLHNTKEKDFELRNKKVELNIKEIQLQKQKLYVIGAIVIIVAFLLIVFILAFYYHAKNKSNQLLSAKNNQLNELNSKLTQSIKDKEVLLKEIHHRVKNNLQLVMSLLNIQAKDSQQISIQDFLEKGQARIATMALIHQNLYLSDDFSNIDFQSYLEILIDNVKKTFNENKVAIAINSNGNTFGLDTAIPLGIIINEIVCNALKHAFPEDRIGKIQIEIQKKEENTFELHIGDNGIGNSKVAKTSSIGLELVSLLVMQLRGKINTINQIGTNYCIEFMQLE
jgi:two-component sensor histidine kinase